MPLGFLAYLRVSSPLSSLSGSPKNNSANSQFSSLQVEVSVSLSVVASHQCSCLKQSLRCIV